MGALVSGTRLGGAVGFLSAAACVCLPLPHTTPACSDS